MRGQRAAGALRCGSGCPGLLPLLPRVEVLCPAGPAHAILTYGSSRQHKTRSANISTVTICVVTLCHTSFVLANLEECLANNQVCLLVDLVVKDEPFYYLES